MKNRIIPFVLFIAVLTACGPKRDPNLTYFDKASEYNDYILTEKGRVSEAYQGVLIALILGSREELESALESLKTKAADGVEKMNRLAAYHKNTGYRDQAKAFFGFCLAASTNELKEQMDIMMDEGRTEEKNARYGELADILKNRHEKLEAEFYTEQKNFSEQFHL